MAKAVRKAAVAKKPAKELEQKFEDKIREAMRMYGIKTVEDRAIADLHDGLKPVHRRILWTMYEGAMTSDKATVKVSKIVGACFLAGTAISTPKGDVAIEHLEIGDVVNTSVGPKRVTKTFENPPADVAELTLDDGKTVFLTLEQEVKIKIGDDFFWKPANELTKDDCIVVCAD